MGMVGHLGVYMVLFFFSFLKRKMHLLVCFLERYVYRPTNRPKPFYFSALFLVEVANCCQSVSSHSLVQRKYHTLDDFTSTKIWVVIYIYIYVCVCVCWLVTTRAHQVDMLYGGVDGYLQEQDVLTDAPWTI